MNDAIQQLAKKQRTGGYRATLHSHNRQLEVESRFLYFDVIPENPLDNIVRFHSRSPNALNWPNYTRLEDIHNLYDVAGELGRFLHGRFTGVYVSSKFSPWVDLRLNEIGAASDGIILCTPAFLLAIIPYRRVIPSFESLFVERISPGDRNLLQSLNLGSLSKQWPNIRCLIFREGSVRNWTWFETFGKDLETLHVHGAHVRLCMKMNIVIYCTKLLHLDLQEGSWDGGAIDHAMFWKRVGKHLETICARFSQSRFNQSDKAHTDNIVRYCANIKRLHLSGDNDGNAKCIAFYGEQMEEATMDILREDDLRLLSSSCRNARFTLHSYKNSDVRIALDILGPQLKAVDNRYIAIAEYVGEIPPDWSSCTNLESVQYRRGLTIEDMRCLLAKPKSILKRIEFTGATQFFNKEDLKELSSLFSRGTGALEKLVLPCLDPPLVLYKSLVESNKNLSNVRIMFHRPLSDVKKKDVLETFLKCPSLKRLFLAEPRQRSADALVSAMIPRGALRSRRIWIYAFGKILVSERDRPRWSSIY